MKAKELVSKNRDPNWKTLRDKGSSGSSGAHKDKRNAELQGKVKHKKDFISGMDEASYPGNIGAMEVFKFMQLADPAQKNQFKELLGKGKKGLAWKLIQDVAGIRLQGDEFEEGWKNNVAGAALAASTLMGNPAQAEEPPSTPIITIAYVQIDGEMKKYDLGERFKSAREAEAFISKVLDNSGVGNYHIDIRHGHR